MSDTITGVVVLQRMPEPGIWRLWFEYTRGDGLRGFFTIPMKPKDAPHPAGHEGPLWDFVQRNPWLDCSPSVRILGPREGAPDHFHNEGQWTNYFVIMAQPYGSEPEAREVVEKINFKGSATKEQRDEVILEYRAQGVLL